MGSRIGGSIRTKFQELLQRLLSTFEDIKLFAALKLSDTGLYISSSESMADHIVTASRLLMGRPLYDLELASYVRGVDGVDI